MDHIWRKEGIKTKDRDIFIYPYLGIYPEHLWYVFQITTAKLHTDKSKLYQTIDATW